MDWIKFKKLKHYCCTTSAVTHSHCGIFGDFLQKWQSFGWCFVWLCVGWGRLHIDDLHDADVFVTDPHTPCYYHYCITAGHHLWGRPSQLESSKSCVCVGGGCTGQAMGRGPQRSKFNVSIGHLAKLRHCVLRWFPSAFSFYFELSQTLFLINSKE